ncbi:acetylornithine deacetylase/succinyl-diaminopimelate desuccinylase-like protein [Arcanobacterium wilhelmae]|uniref:Acetylornithine deacetylase/succinyl-diaminopimelate desuccinylase-like protein n=1 Tax=Arcanobacterium wilhelmae TaxID=1803177 RepID=A0ABT9N8D3_9ACTO|nr:M20/M25/M40 family metallo-hydrolase [Arcanobacterium wilhelmae]MDP9799964.1 acetylornithine deacetylase/succinyl-diaminopimelate desuccinylase-like protein [Arcanobacterium wilhelmae]WFN91097.1 M20/M25/M40 family metallo-hydrolase [Arcanobacterium wilhelmae]
MQGPNEALGIARKLIQFDTTNHGGPGEIETPAAHYVMDLLHEVGLEPQWFESEPGRPSVVVRIPGKVHEGALVIHGHLDVVPAVASDWSVDPFGGVIKDGYLWGRGAVDMKNMVAMMLAVLRDIARTGFVPARDLIFCFFADEERGGHKGSIWLIEHHPEVFAGATDAISEVGGYNTYVAGRPVFLLQTAEKSLTWYRLTARGRAGHGSQMNRQNAVTALATALSRIGNEQWPLQLTPTVRTLLEGVARLSGVPFDPNDTAGLERLVEQLGPAQTFVGATLRTGANPTQLDAGYLVNVIPQTATGGLDVRAIPGTEEAVKERIRELLGSVEAEYLHDDDGIEAPFHTPLVDAMIRAVQAEEPDAVVLPYMLSAGSDNKTLSKLGIRGYGFAPTRVPEGFDFPAMFHGVDERIPVDSLPWGTRVLHHFVSNFA